MQIRIDDDFDLQKIKNSGQCFRIKKFDDGTYRFITGTHILYIKALGNNVYEVSCSKDDWDSIWIKYFDLDRNYKELRQSLYGINSYVDEAINAGVGLRILRQNPFETLVSFIIAQRKSIKAIEKSVDQLCTFYGKAVPTSYEESVSLFPSVFDLHNCDEQDLLDCSLGYRADYIIDTVDSIYNNKTVLYDLEGCKTSKLLEQLQKYRGVGIKIASCVALFGFGRFDCVPVDVWIQRVIDEEFNGVNLFDKYGDNAGIIQQYVYMYKRGV